MRESPSLQLDRPAPSRRPQRPRGTPVSSSRAAGTASGPGGARRLRRLRFGVGYALYCAACVAVILAAGELVLRVGLGLPSGKLKNIVDANGSRLLWPPSQRIEMSWGVVPYVVKTNALGFRGAEISPQKVEGVVRIAALGDSITAGFFVDNEETFPHLLQQLLAERGCRAEVINAARGGESIDREYAILQQEVLPLGPDVALLTFCTNDIHGIRAKPRESLVPPQALAAQHPDGWKRTVYRLTVHSALTEFVVDRYLRARLVHYRYSERGGPDRTGGRRYEIPGGDDYEANVKLFKELGRDCDGICLTGAFDPEVRKLIDNYAYALRHMDRSCREHGVQLVFVYFPAYNQIYQEHASLRIRDVLARQCRSAGIPFCDLTPAFRSEGRKRVLHLAPLDFHPNPAGNRLIARTVGDFLIARGLCSGDGR
jgi:lysophospholipase L1-like esterase